MPGCTLNARSMQRLDGVHPDLVKVVLRAAALTEQPFQITEGLRTLQRQKQLVKQGASRTLRSRHLTGHAVDVVAIVDESGAISWDLPRYKAISAAFKEAANELQIAVEWGGDWKSFVDSPHFQLAHKDYPASEKFKPIDRTERDLLAAGSRTVRKARVVRQIGQGAVVVGTIATSVINDPLGSTTTIVTSVGQGREVVTAARDHLTWILQPGNVAIGLIVLGLVIAAGAAAIISYRVEDDNTGRHIGRE